jgi:hypothetical protein
MNSRPKTRAELPPGLLARTKDLEPRVAQVRSRTQRRPNLPVIIALMTVIFLAYGWSQYHGQKTGAEYVRDLIGYQHWRHPWLFGGMLIFGLCVAVYDLTRRFRNQPARIWPFLVLMGFAVLALGLETFPGWDNLRTANWWWHHWPVVLRLVMLITVVAFAWTVGLADARRKRQKRAAETQWNRILAAAVDVHDFKEPEDLYAYLDAGERARLLQCLQRMPKGARSLKQAVHQICPEITGNEL